jgi:hypothetical protein
LEYDVRKLIAILIIIVCLNMTACGYFLYPERVGSKGGKLDTAIVVLDAAALLFGILPGVVAFAVDITTGAIYLPPGQKSVIEKHSKTLVSIDGKKLRPAEDDEITIDQVKAAHELSKLLGFPVKWERVKYFKAIDMQAAVLAKPVQCHNLSEGLLS